MTNYALADFFGIALACLLFSTLALFPGYLLGYSLNLWEFRKRTPTFQLAASVPLSIGIGPILTFFCDSIAWPIYICATLAALVLLFRNRPAIDKTLRRALLIGIGWSLFATIWLMDWQFSSNVYFPTYALDYSTRAAMVHSLATFGLPAQTPFLNPGHPVALHYHFLWLLQCSLIPGSARLAFIAGAIWCGLGLMCVSALAMRILMQQRSWIVIGLLAVTGLDIIPALLLLLANRLHLINTLPPSAEWWNEQVDGFVYTVLWEPHYICALIACITGFLLIWQSKRVSHIVVAALCFATAVGSGSFVALVFAVFLAGLVVARLRDSVPLVITGVLAILFSLPYLATLRAPAQNVAGGSLLKLTIRQFSPFPMSPTVNLLLLPLNYFLELGFFICGFWRKQRALLLMAITSLLICTFLKSGATPNNDLGWRGVLVAQFALLILCASYLQETRPNWFLKTMLILGLCGTTYDLALTRLFPILSDANQVPKLKWLSLDEKLGARTRANRDAYTWLQNHSARNATIGQNPNVDSIDIFSALYSERRLVAGDRTCTVGFGGTAAECASVEVPLAKLFKGEMNLSAACAALPADFYTIKDADPVWSQAQTWAAVFANSYVRVFSCDKR